MTIDQDFSDNVLRVLTKRRSVRHFLDRPLEKEDLDKILTAAIAAPSGSNTQNQRFLVLQEPEDKLRLGSLRFVWPYRGSDQAKMKKARPGGILGGAACLVVVFADAGLNDSRGNGEYYIWESLEIQNCAASIENMLNMATALGIGSCWVSASERMSRTRLLSGRSWAHALAAYDIPPNFKIQGIVLLGYPKSNDEEGFPSGERMHGATYWSSTERRPISEYLVQRRNSDVASQAGSPTSFQKVKVRACAGAAGFLLRLLRRIDKMIHQVEVEMALGEIHSKLRDQDAGTRR